MKIANFDLAKDILIVAEIGNNHEGNYALAKNLIRLAKKAGADAVKFQTIIPEKLVSAGQYERIRQLKKFQLSYGEFIKLSKVAREEGILFLSTPFDTGSVKFLAPLVPAFKISSGDNNFFPLIDAVARTAKPIILSTGLADISQIAKTVNFIRALWKKLRIKQDIALLHCVSSYPVAPQEANLEAIRTLGNRFGVTVGYSDHTLGIDAAVLSVALDARIIEKHFTIDKNYSDFRDHKISLDTGEFKLLVQKVRYAEQLLGDGIKHLQKSEKEALKRARRSIVAKYNLDKGTVLSSDNIDWVRTQDDAGLAPGMENKILKKKLARSVQRGESILLKDTGSIRSRE